MNVLSDRVIDSSDYVEAYTGKYFFTVDTLDDAIFALNFNCIYPSRGYKLTEIEKVPASANVVFVRFALSKNSGEYETRIMTVQKKYLKRFTRFLTTENKQNQQ